MKHFTRFFLLLLNFTPVISAFSQHHTDKNISGIIADKNTFQTIEYASVVLYKSSDSTIVSGCISDNKGYFIIDKLNSENYYLKISFIGYNNLTIGNIYFDNSLADKNLGNIYLQAVSTKLNNVEITAEKNQVEFNLDKKVVNVDKNLVLAGGTAVDIMQTIPSVTVDIDGNVSLRGSTAVTILVDGRPSGLTSLDEIPAGMIEKVEIVTNPSAKYDPEGMSGIINIILKKKKEPGYNGTINFNAGTGDKYDGSLNLNYRLQKVNFFTNYSTRYITMTGYSKMYRESYFEDTTSYLDQMMDFGRKGHGHNIKGGFDWYINDKNLLTISGVYGNRKFEGNDIYTVSQSDHNSSLTDYYERYVKSSHNMQGIDASANYKKTFKEKDREWTVDIMYEKHNRNAGQDMELQNFNTDYSINGTAELQNSLSGNINNEIILQTNYIHPLKNGRLETGYKGSLNINNLDYQFYKLDDVSMVMIYDSLTSNKFTFNEQIHALYLIYGNNINKVQYQAGIRIEEALTTADQITQNAIVKRDKLSLFPTFHLKYLHNKHNAFQISYTRRINRPNVRALNPFIDYSDPLNLSVGNPYLKPEYIDALEAAYEYEKNTTNISLTIFHRQISGVISRIMTIDHLGIATSTFDNINNSSSSGIEFIVAQKIFKWWKYNANGSYFYQQFSGENISELSKSSYSYTAKINSSWTPAKTFDIQLSFNYNSPVVSSEGSTSHRFFMIGSGQGKVLENYWFDAGLKKDFYKGNFSFNIRVSDIFKTIKFDMESWSDNYYSMISRRRESRVIFASITYKINGGLKQFYKKRSENNQEDYYY